MRKDSTRAYMAWRAMKKRCYVPKNPSYKTHGGRGITVCERWRNDFSSFLADMGEPSDGLSLDRIDNDGPYSPENCRWADHRQQGRNRRTCRLLTAFGQTLALVEWAEKVGFCRTVIASRLKAGWSIERALSEPVVPKTKRKDALRLTYRGETLTAYEWGKRTGLGDAIIRSRFRMGWQVEEILTRPVAKKRRAA